VCTLTIKGALRVAQASGDGRRRPLVTGMGQFGDKVVIISDMAVLMGALFVYVFKKIWA